MNGRRGFFKNLFGGAAVAAIAAKAEPPALPVQPVVIPPRAPVFKFDSMSMSTSTVCVMFSRPYNLGVGDYVPSAFETPQIVLRPNNIRRR